MAITINEVKAVGGFPGSGFGGFKERVIKATLGNYTTNGYPITAANALMKKILFGVVHGSIKGYPCKCDLETTNNGILIKCYSTAGTEMANDASTIASEVIYVRVKGY